MDSDGVRSVVNFRSIFYGSVRSQLSALNFSLQLVCSYFSNCIGYFSVIFGPKKKPCCVVWDISRHSRAKSAEVSAS